nr:hypothetical protein [Eubacterium sp.]
STCSVEVIFITYIDFCFRIGVIQIHFIRTSTTYSYNETTKKFTITTISRGYKDDYSYHDSNTTYSFKPDKDDPDYGYWTIRRTRDYMETYGNTRTETFYYTK